MKIRTWHVIGAVFTMLFGTFLHFAYEISGFIPIFAVLGSVNESVWEHLKLIYWPSVIFAFAEYCIYGRKTCGFFAAKAFALVSAMLFVAAAYYTYCGILGKNIGFANVLIFVLSCVIMYAVSYAKIKKVGTCTFAADAFGFVIFILFACAFCVYSFTPPHGGIFSVPQV